MSKCAKARFWKRAVEIAHQYGLRSGEQDEKELMRLSSVTAKQCGADNLLDWSSSERG
jgi:hypothetical protein